MSASLLDVNVLVALFDEAHASHDEAHAWFGANRKNGWATCPLIVNGVVRVLSWPAYPTVQASPAEVIRRLAKLCSDPDHHFWPDEISLLDDRIFRSSLIANHRQIMDVYLLALAVHKGGRLVTFDRSISTRAVVGAEPSHLKLLG